MTENKETAEKEKLRGKTGLIFLAVAAGEFLLFWFMVFYFPRLMIPVSLLLSLMSLYVYRNSSFQEEFRLTLGLSAKDLAKLRKYEFAWIFISLYGFVFAIVLSL
jgi:hypothetical protein